jgi:uncharacterized protein YukE
MASLEIKAINLAKIQARIARLPASAARALKAQLKTEVDNLVPAIQRAMDIQYESTADADHQRVRDSVHAYENKNRAISYFVIADARDAEGKFIGSNVEQGHRAADGSHVAAQPAFWPTYRAGKKGMKRRLSAAGRKAIREEWGS